MSLFSPKKKIEVASSVYNMAGEEADRMNYMKSTIFSSIVAPSDVYLGETIVGSHLNGPAIRQRSFFNWSKQKSYAGLPGLSIQQVKSVDPDEVRPYIPVPSSPAGLETKVQTASLVDGDYTYFAEKYIIDNHPELIDTDFASEYDSDSHTITIQYVGGSTDVIPAGDFDVNKDFIVAEFFQTLPSDVQPVETGDLVVNEGSAPDTTDYELESTSNTGVVNHSLTYDKTVTKTYSDSTPTDGPTTTTITDSIDWNGIETVHSKSEYYGTDNGDAQTIDIATFLHIFERRQVVDRVTTTVETNDLGGGVTETVTTTIDGDHLDPIYDYRYDTQETINGKVVGGDQMWIYTVGSGITYLDDLAVDLSVGNEAEFYPFIPIRLKNRSITNQRYDESGNGLYKESRDAYKRASSGNSFESLIEQVEDNQDIDDVDYCYMGFGVSLNTNEKVGLKYAYDFFKMLIPYQNTTGSFMQNFIYTVNNYTALREAYDDWKEAQLNTQKSNPLHGTPAPPYPNLTSPKTTTLKIRPSDTRMRSFDNRITWVSIDEDFFVGQGKSGAVKGDIWFQKAGVFSWALASSQGSFYRDYNIQKTYLFWQIDDNNFKRLTIYGLVHRNYIYGGKYVLITAHDALDDNDTSGFLLPLHNPTFKAMSLVDSTQLSLSNSFLIFNSYEVVKKKWYQTFIGMLLIIVVVVVISVLIGPSAMSGAVGFFGANAAVGASLGLSGTAAIIAGAVTNAIAGIIIAGIITGVSTDIFGEKWGAIIGSIISFAVTFGMSGGFSDFGLLTTITPQNLLAMSSALANGYQGFVQADIEAMNSEMTQMAEENAEQMEDLNEMIRSLGGSNDLSFDPMQLTDVNAGNGSGTGSYTPESLDEFIHRTTMTGSDIVDITLSMIENYTNLSLQLPQN